MGIRDQKPVLLTSVRCPNIPRDSKNNLGWEAPVLPIKFLFFKVMPVFACVRAQSCLTLCDLTAVALQAPLSMGFSGQEYWSGLPFLPPGDLPHPGIEPASPASSALTGRFFTFEPPWKPLSWRLPDSQVTTPNGAKMRLIPQLNIHWALGLFIYFIFLQYVLSSLCITPLGGLSILKRQTPLASKLGWSLSKANVHAYDSQLLEKSEPKYLYSCLLFFLIQKIFIERIPWCSSG